MKAAQVEIVSSSPAVAAVQWLAAQPGVEFAGFDPAWTTVAELARWKAALPSQLRRSFLSALAAPLVEPLAPGQGRRRTGAHVRGGADGLQALRAHPRLSSGPGLREIEVAAELEHQARLLGAEGMSFETIVASGVRSALPHGRATTGSLPRRGFLTLDFGIILKGYCSDMTRTVHLGKPQRRGAERLSKRCWKPRRPRWPR